MAPEIATLTRMGRIDFKNCYPFYHGLFESPAVNGAEFEMYESYPTKINLSMRKGLVDIAPISSLEYCNHHDDYYVLPGLAIAARDFSGSVMLISKKKIEDLDGETIYLSRQSLSSATLLRILLRFNYKLSNKFVSTQASIDEILDKEQAVMTIGDEALFYESRGHVHKYDLSKLWWQWTEKPFCFALWAVRKEFADANRKWVKILADTIVENRDRNLLDIERFVRDAFGVEFTDPEFSKLYGYFFNLVFYLDDEIRSGLELFYRLAYRLGASPRLDKIQFFPGD